MSGWIEEAAEAYALGPDVEPGKTPDYYNGLSEGFVAGARAVLEARGRMVDPRTRKRALNVAQGLEEAGKLSSARIVRLLCQEHSDLERRLRAAVREATGMEP